MWEEPKLLLWNTQTTPTYVLDSYTNSAEQCRTRCADRNLLILLNTVQFGDQFRRESDAVFAEFWTVWLEIWQLYTSQTDRQYNTAPIH